MTGMLLGQRAVTGKSLISGFDNSDPSFAFANLMKMTGTLSSTTATYAFPAVLDSNGYPNNAPSNSLPHDLRMNIKIPAAWGTSVLVFKFRGTGVLYFQEFGGSNLDYTVDSAPTGTNVVDSSASNIIHVSGTDVRMTFHFNSAPNASFNYVTYFVAGTYINMSDLVLCRLSDEAAITANPNAFNPDFISQLTTLNPKIIRTMDWSGVFEGNSQFAQRAPSGALSFFADRFAPEYWAGTASGTDTYTCSTPSSWAGLVDGAAVQVQFTNANTVSGAGLTLNVGSTGAVRMTDLGPNDLAIGRIAAGSIWTFIYSSVYNYWTGQLTSTLTTGAVVSGFRQRAPLEQHIALANAVNAHLWWNIPHRYSPTDAAAIVAVVKANLNPTLKFYVELSNEVWNSGNDQTSFITNMGMLFGFPSSNNRDNYGAYGLLVRRMMGAITTAWGGVDSRLRRVSPVQAFGESNVGGNYDLYRFQGKDLAPSGTSTGVGNALYSSWTGSANYTTSPNRPIDYCDVISYATYYAGGELMQFDQQYVNLGLAGKNINNLTNAADQFTVAGTVSTALAWVDNDLRRGLQSDGSAGSQTMLDLATNIYPNWEAIAASYEASRPGIGLSALTVDCYEGGIGIVAPSTATCTSLGISTTYSVKISNLIEAYKNNGLFQALAMEQFKQFMAQAHSATPAWYGYPGSSPWAYFTGDIYTGPPYGTAYKSWDANVAFNH